jgi:hypothetical protein
VTRAEPLTDAGAGEWIAWVAAAAGVRTAARAIAETLAVPVAEPLVGIMPGGIETGGAAPVTEDGDWIGTVSDSGGGTMPGARWNLGVPPVVVSPGRPLLLPLTAPSSPPAAGAPESDPVMAASLACLASSVAAEAVPDFACVSVIN